MSGVEGPRRRRIAGETGQTQPSQAKKRPIPSRKPRVAKPPAAKSPVPPPPSKVPTKAPAAKSPMAKPMTSAVTTREPSPPTPWWILVAAAAAVATVLAGLVLGGFALWGGSSSDGPSDADQRSASAASTASETIFSFTFDKLDEHLTESKALMTGPYAEEFDKIAPSLTELAPQREIQVEAVTRNAAVVPCGDECADDTVTVLIFIDQVRLVGDSAEPTVFANRIEVTMQNVDGRWLVDDVRAV